MNTQQCGIYKYKGKEIIVMLIHYTLGKVFYHNRNGKHYDDELKTMTLDEFKNYQCVKAM